MVNKTPEHMNDYNNFQLNKISKEAFAKERWKFVRFFMVFLLIIIVFLCVVLRIKELFLYAGIPFLYALAVAFSIRGMNKVYKSTPLYVKVAGRHMVICYGHSYIQMPLGEIDYIAQFYIRRRSGVSTRNMFRGRRKGEEFWLEYEYLEDNYLIKHYIKENWIDKKDTRDMEFLRRESRTYELKNERIGHIRIENITSLKLESEPSKGYVELFVYNDRNKKYVLKYTGKKLAEVIIKCYKIESLYHIPFTWANYSYVPLFEDEIASVYKKNEL
jgi:hypothetical protein